MVSLKKKSRMVMALLLVASAFLGVQMPALSGNPGTVHAQTVSNKNPFGLMLGSPGMNVQQRLGLARQLGAVYFRPASVFLADWDGTCPDCAAYQASGLGIILTVRDNGDADRAPAPSSPPTDLDTYSSKLGDLLDLARPQVVVVENEENSILSYSGTPQEYAVELQAACDVAHSKGVKCANGGLVSGELALLVWADYFERGQAAQACNFAQRAFEPAQAQLVCGVRAEDALPNRIKQSLAEGKALLDVYKASGIDYVNFHWYVPDAQALGEAVAFLTRVTGVMAMTNEIGQLDANPQTVTALMSKVVELKLPYAVWLSVDGQAQGLVNPDGSVRPNGQAFRAFIQQRFGVTPIPGNQTFEVGTRFLDYYNKYQGPKTLGPPIGPVIGNAQYFEKGRLEDHSDIARGDWAFSYGLLVPELIAGKATVRLAGNSGGTYSDLGPQVAPSSRTRSPTGRSGLAVDARGRAFIPFDPFLRGNVGHVVPAYFWAYMNDPSLFPAGWLHDVGLPMSEATTIQVNKNGQNRAVTIQVFERTILSYDPLNPPAFQVERANVGLAYRDAFPARVLGPSGP